MEKLAQQNVLHAEVYVSVGVIHWRGQEFEPIFEGMERGFAQSEPAVIENPLDHVGRGSGKGRTPGFFAPLQPWWQG